MSESRKRRGETTREAILKAAEVVFAEHGFDGARIDTIAEVSGYNKTLIFRYFGDKLGLYTQVLKQADREMGELLAHVFTSLLEDETAASQAHRFRAFLLRMIQTLFDYLLEHPRFVRMLTWEMAEGWQTFTQIASQFPTEDTDQFETLFHKARSTGLLRSDFVPVIQLSMMVPICQAYLAYLPLYQRLLPGEDLSSASALARAREYLVDFVVAGMMSGLYVKERKTDEMTMIVPSFDDAVVIREADAEVLGLTQLSTRLLADSDATGGALSVMRTTMGEGIEGARPHTHSKSAELFYILDGELQILTGERVITARKGDLVVIPPDMAHAFATTSGHTANFLIVLAPGLERFGYFRLVERLSRGEATLEGLLASQELYDNHFLQSPVWRAARG